MQELLNKMTKQELINLILEFCEDGKLNASMVEEYLSPKQITPDQRAVLLKLQNKEPLTDTDLSFVASSLQKKENTKIASILKGRDLFVEELVQYKINSFFNGIWKIYPRKVGKEMGLKAFTKLVSEYKYKDLKRYCEFVYNRVKRYIEHCEESGTEEQYILHFSTFCNSKKYL
jgi:hypothetical protein